MTDLATMKVRIADDLSRDDLTTQIAGAIASALQTWEGDRFWFNEKRFRLDTVAGTEYYALPSSLKNTDNSALAAGETLLELDSITAIVNGEPYPLNERTQQFMDRHYGSITNKGQPCDYSWFADQLRFGPIPDAVYQCTLSGLARLKTLSAGTDTNAWMTEGEALIRAETKLILYRDVLQDQEGIALAKDAIATALAPLERKSSAKVATGSIRPWGSH